MMFRHGCGSLILLILSGTKTTIDKGLRMGESRSEWCPLVGARSEGGRVPPHHHAPELKTSRNNKLYSGFCEEQRRLC